LIVRGYFGAYSITEKGDFLGKIIRLAKKPKGLSVYKVNYIKCITFKSHSIVKIAQSLLNEAKNTGDQEALKIYNLNNKLYL